MGIHAENGCRASQNSLLVCSERGIDLGNHRSRTLIPEELIKSDFIFVMEPLHKEFLRVFFPQVFQKTFLLGSWPGIETRKSTVKDPVGRTIKEYRKTLDLIENHIERIIPELIRKLSQSPDRITTVSSDNH